VSERISLQGKRILLGVTGSIAAYKAVELLRELLKRGAAVQVVMTEAAARFVAPLTFETLSRQPVLLDMWSLQYGSKIGHIEATARADLFLIAPATARSLAKLALGLADDFLGNIYLASRCPVLVAPAMDADMYRHAAVQANLARLRERGVRVVGPGTGELASGLMGPGRLAELPEILAAAEALLARAGDLAGEVVLVTAGPTREPIDPVRYLSNRSSGKMGYAVADAAQRRGARAILVSGPVSIDPPVGVEVIRVETAAEMRAAVLEHSAEATIIVKAAAVADFRPVSPSATKIRRGKDRMTLELEPTADILAELARHKGERILVGFAAETEDIAARAQEKLRRKDADIVVANDVTREGAGFDADTNIVTIFTRHGERIELPKLSKLECAYRILDEVLRLRRASGQPAEVESAT
jgi:phosphopantothenoylcysteine decarboxylase/phosphopantothenate--cysteine ligase